MCVTDDPYQFYNLVLEQSGMPNRTSCKSILKSNGGSQYINSPTRYTHNTKGFKARGEDTIRENEFDLSLSRDTLRRQEVNNSFDNPKIDRRAQLRDLLSKNRKDMEDYTSSMSVSLERSLSYKPKASPIKQRTVFQKKEKATQSVKEQDMSVLQSGRHISEMKVYSYREPADSCKWRPQIREGATISQVGGLAYYVGGTCGEVFNDINELDIYTYTWKRIQCEHYMGKSGHTCVVYKKCIYFFGGWSQYNANHKMQGCINATEVYNPVLNQFKQIRCYGEFIEARRNHTAVVVGRYMFVIGGINANQTMIGDVCTLNLENFKWQVMHVDRPIVDGIAFHSATPIYNGEINMEHPYKAIDVIKGKDVHYKAKYEGIYLFGGTNQKGEISNKLLVIQLGCRPIKVLEPITMGLPPIARYMHTISYIEEKLILVVCGGRNDAIQDVLVNNGIVNQLIVLTVHNMNWVGVIQSGLFKGDQRCLHASLVVDTKILVMGGFNQEYCSSNILVLEFDPLKSKTQRLAIAQGEANNRSARHPQDDEKTGWKLHTRGFQRQCDKLCQGSVVSYLPLPARSSSSLIKKFLIKRYTQNIVKKTKFAGEETEVSLHVPTLEGYMTQKLEKKLQNREVLTRWVEHVVINIMNNVD